MSGTPVIQSPNEVARWLNQHAGKQIVAVDPHPECDGAVFTLRTVGRRQRTYVAVVRTAAGMHCSEVREGSRILAEIEAAKWKART